jgi:hypothetical protein
MESMPVIDRAIACTSFGDVDQHPVVCLEPIELVTAKGSRVVDKPCCAVLCAKLPHHGVAPVNLAEARIMDT